MQKFEKVQNICYSNLIWGLDGFSIILKHSKMNLVRWLYQFLKILVKYALEYDYCRVISSQPELLPINDSSLWSDL
jgi:hypothetical protein